MSKYSQDPVANRVAQVIADALARGATPEEAAAAGRAEAEKYGTADLKAADAHLADGR